MKQATITIIETESGQLDINVAFCTKHEDSIVNEVAMFAVMKINEDRKSIGGKGKKSQAIGEFLEWAQSEGYFLASWQHFGNPEPEGYDRLVTSRKTIHQWLAEFFEIDQDKIEKERQALLDEIRAGNH
jgi:hypothetical protein